LSTLEDEKLIHKAKDGIKLTRRGIAFVEKEIFDEKEYR